MAASVHAIFVFLLVSYAFTAPLPIVLMHGIAATASDLDHVMDVLRATFPGIYLLADPFACDELCQSQLLTSSTFAFVPFSLRVRSIEIGGSEAYLGSIIIDIAFQVDSFCETVKSDPNLQNTTINVLGFSQGGIIARGFIEKCEGAPPVNTFISWVSPQTGTFGVPKLGNKKGLPKDIDQYMSHMMECCIYDTLGQEALSFAGYWKDPMDYDAYLNASVLLADINNERPVKNPIYKKRITSLKQMALSYSTIDTILQPKETGWWSYYEIGSNKSHVIPVQDTPFYTEDWLGLRVLNETGRLTFFSTDCHHGDYWSSCFDQHFTANVIPLLQKSHEM